MSDGCDIDATHDAVLPLQTTLRNDGPVALNTTLAVHVTDIRDARQDQGDPIAVDGATALAATRPSANR